LSRLEPPEPPNRYCRRHPGELVHIDVKKLARFNVPGHRVISRGPGTHTNRGIGWEFVHVAIDDTSRLAYLEILRDEKGPTCVAFLERAITWFAERGVTVQRVMTDNGTGYLSKIHAAAITQLGIKHLRTRPYRPRTNGKACEHDRGAAPPRSDPGQSVTEVSFVRFVDRARYCVTARPARRN
jgi:transposase InsO family protein